jgi:hypothetical protein
LTYSVGYEQVFQNGVLLVRGSNYTATNGTSISLSNASVTGDVFEVFAAQPVAISDVYTQAQANAAFIPDSIVTTKGDIIVATGSGTVVRQGVGADNSFLVADSAQADGVKWATATEQYPWTSFTPTLNNWTLGNGTVVGKYQQIGKTINLFFKFTFGSTSSLSSFPNFALPINAANTLGQNVTINLQDAGTADNAGNVYLATNTVYPGAFNTAGTYISVVPISATVPFTWTTNDTITVQFTYEAV